MPDESPIVLSTTAFNTAALCLKKYEYRFIDRLISRPRDVKPTIRRGTWIHRCLELNDHGKPWLSELGQMADWATDQGVEGVDELYQNVLHLVDDYLQFWSGHENKEGGPYETVATELPVKYMPRPDRGFSATIDRVVRDPRGKLWIWERKTTQDIPDADWRGVDPQTLIQLYAARKEGYECAGVIFDYVRTDPGPVLQVYKPSKQGRGGRLYDSVLSKSVTSRAFDGVVPEIVKNWQTGGDGMDWGVYVQQMRVRLVQDEAWFVRYPVFRPDDMVLETMRDVATAIRNVENARRSGHYQRSVNVLTCRLFCEYSKLCMHEYRLGRPSLAIREELFTVETPELRAEGRSINA